MNGIVDVSKTVYFNYDGRASFNDISTIFYGNMRWFYKGYLNESGIYENVLFDLYDPTKLQAFDPLNFERYAKERAT
ncbi:hypothetical protein BB560_000809 [Smittium megazygosporum]|uniref:Uncharacterized protein n=1 Tax=Smittium megazygosporum TaxID=133381 RepID=A0A2T9ZJE7_9FUNG|nr:hypothetical protein BB560_000809 [Smittium megazygosporum]